MLDKQDFKTLIDSISVLIDARAKTTETLLKAEIKASEQRVKKELREEILAARAEAKLDTVNLHSKIDKVLKSHEHRITALEDEIGIQHKN